MTRTAPPSTTAPPRQRRAVLAASAGTLVEGYDWILYSSFAALIAPALFFSAADPLAATLGGLITLAAAIVARPVGMLVASHFADRYGRRPVLLATVALMGAATAALAVLPTYAQVGTLAPVLLFATRIVQGIAYGGEWGPATLVAAEDATRGRGRAAAAVAAALTGGSVLATLMLLAVTAGLSQEQLLAWGWRIPFALGAVLAVAVLLIRRGVPETGQFEASRTRGELVANPVRDTFRRHGAVTGLLIVVVGGTASAFYIPLILGQSWGIQVGYSRIEVTLLTLALSIGMVISSLIAGRRVDRVGARTVIGAATIASAVLALPWALLVGSGALALALLGALLLGGVAAISFAAFGAYAGGFFPTPLRASGLSLSVQLGSVIGGLMPVAATALLGVSGSILPVVVLIIVLQVVALLALRRLGADKEWTS